MPAPPNELRILFTRTGDALSHQLVLSGGGHTTAPQPFPFSLTGDDHEDLRWYLEDYLDLPAGGARVRAARIEASLGTWGRQLFAAVFDPAGHLAHYRALLDGPAPRRLTLATQDLEVLRLPWELLTDGDGPLCRKGITLRRQLELTGPPETFTTGTLPLRILLVVSRPDGDFIDPRHTTRAMLDALDPLGDGVAVDFCRPATLERLEGMLADAERDGRSYHIVHFDGHGTFEPVTQRGMLLFEQDWGFGPVTSDPVPAKQLGAVLAKHRIPLVVLEACRSGTVGRGGTAPQVMEAGVGSVLAMSHAVHVEATRILLRRFYQALVEGATVGQAVEQGRAALREQPDRWLKRGLGEEAVALQDWFLPTLYQRDDDPVLVPHHSHPRAPTTPRSRARSAQRGSSGPRDAGARRMAATGSEVGAFPAEPRHGFFGRAWELQRLERRFMKNRAVVLHAMGGMGKTSLAREAALWGGRTGLFPDGACFVSFEQPGGGTRAIQVLGAYFEGAEFERRSAEEQRKQARELFQTKRVLVVWDNFESVLPAFQEGEVVAPYPPEEREEIYRLFREWTEEDKGLGRLLITCRPGETGLTGVCKVELKGLAQADALSLLDGVMRKEGVSQTHERDALVGLLEVVDMHPLSIELVGPHLRKMGPGEIVRDFQKLLDEFKGEAEVERNRSLRASIGFSLMRLSKEVRKAVGWLGLFRGGVFEDNLLEVSQMNPAVWEEARGQLEATALMRVEREINLNEKHYLRFHPTLAMAAGDGADEAGVRERYVEVYEAVGAGVDKALHGSNPRWGMEVMVREEANFRRAVGWALEQRSHGRASPMGHTLAVYLQMAGRLQERNRWAVWLAGEVRKGGFNSAVAHRDIDEARALLSQGEPRKAIEKLEALIVRLRTTTEFDAAFVRANACEMLGSVYVMVGGGQKAIPVLRDAVQQWEALVDKEHAAGKDTDTERGNLAGALGSLAHALCDADALDEALRAAERGVAVTSEIGHHRNLASTTLAAARTLMKQGRITDAAARYDEALRAAQRAGDRELEGITLQNQGSLAYNNGQHDRAAKLYERALQLFQDMDDENGVLQTCAFLGAVEQNAGRLAEARAWYERSREIAVRRGNQPSIWAAAQSLGIVYQLEGKSAWKQGDEARARERLTEAARMVNEALRVGIESEDTPREAVSHGNLGLIYCLLGDLDKAEEHAHHARDIHERLGLKEAHIDYNTLAAIARARNNPTEAAVWEQKRDALRAELERRAGAIAPPAEQGHED